MTEKTVITKHDILILYLVTFMISVIPALFLFEVMSVLADKQVMARILKYTLEEFKDIELEEIMRSMDEPVISRVRVEPGQTNFSKVEKKSEEDNVPGEGMIFYDIRFVVYLRKMLKHPKTI